ncbi:hypothetical protein ACFLZP_03070 [Patescibacteria group bacterium]
MSKKSLKKLFLLAILVGIGFLSLKSFNLPFSKLSGPEKLRILLAQRDLAIEESVQAGDYRCCLQPSCTMCYWEANQWNNQKAGTCACDDLIAEGKKPCPQCGAPSFNNSATSHQRDEVGLCAQGGECQINEN